MKKYCIPLLFALFASVLSAPKAYADYVWSTEEYDVVYQEDRSRTAIWTYGEGGVIFIDGLADTYMDLEMYGGYWVQETSSLRCDTYREGVDGEPTYYWGRFEVTFIDAEFPARWEAKFGLCDREPVIPLTGTPVTESAID